MGIRFGIVNRQAGNDSVETAVLPASQTGREIAMDKANSLIGVDKTSPVTHSLKGLGIVGGAVQSNEFLQGTAAVAPKRRGKLATAASQVQPALPGSRRQPRARIG